MLTSVGILLAQWSIALVGSAWPHATTPRIRSASVRRVLLCVQELTPEAQFIAEVHRSITKGSFVKLTLTGNDGSNSTDGKSLLSRLTRIEGRLVNLKQRTKLQLTHKYEHRDTCSNIELAEVPSTLAPLLSAGAFRNGRLMAADADFSLESRKRGRVLHRLKPTASAKPLLPLSHDRVKPLAGAVDDGFLQALGVTGSDGKPNAGKADQLRQIDVQLNELEPRMTELRAQIARNEVKAPVSGEVVGLTIFTQGGVIQAGQTLMEIVPRDASQVIVAQIAPNDVDNLQIGQITEVRFPGLRERNPPIIHGRVTRISADSFTVEETGARYFRAEIVVPASELAKMGRGAETLRPGAPVEVVVLLRKRTALGYLLEPLTNQLWRSGSGQ